MKTLVSVQVLIRELEIQQDKGIEYIQIDGTLYSEEDGNYILCSSEKKM